MADPTSTTPTTPAAPVSPLEPRVRSARSIVPQVPIAGTNKFQLLGRVLFDRSNDTVIHRGDVIQSTRNLAVEKPRLFVATDLPLTPGLEKRVLFRPQVHAPRKPRPVRPVRPAKPGQPIKPVTPAVGPASAPVQPPMTPVAG